MNASPTGSERSMSSNPPVFSRRAARFVKNIETIVPADALAAIRAHYPEATLELVGNAPAAVLLRDSGLVHVVTPFYAAEVMALFAAEPVVAERWRDAELVVLWLTNCEGIAAA